MKKVASFNVLTKKDIEEIVDKKIEEIKKENEEKRKRAIAYAKKYEEELENEKSH